MEPDQFAAIWGSIDRTRREAANTQDPRRDRYLQRQNEPDDCLLAMAMYGLAMADATLGGIAKKRKGKGGGSSETMDA